MEEDKDDTDPVATACAIVIPTVFVAVVFTVAWRNGTLASVRESNARRFGSVKGGRGGG